ncbi:MAG: hypothetical protein AMJ41_03865 [candidate division Zixibacteria bacterium DG_27]|nr:MAG: hypothetical protein AMJ41_03865 [candidate division Zixibacteria bacterium DG_27]
MKLLSGQEVRAARETGQIQETAEIGQDLALPGFFADYPSSKLAPEFRCYLAAKNDLSAQLR